jgi:hypothetical protein
VAADGELKIMERWLVRRLAVDSIVWLGAFIIMRWLGGGNLIL